MSSIDGPVAVYRVITQAMLVFSFCFLNITFLYSIILIIFSVKRQDPSRRIVILRFATLYSGIFFMVVVVMGLLVDKIALLAISAIGLTGICPFLHMYIKMKHLANDGDEEIDVDDKLSARMRRIMLVVSRSTSRVVATIFWNLTANVVYTIFFFVGQGYRSSVVSSALVATALVNIHLPAVINLVLITLFIKDLPDLKSRRKSTVQNRPEGPTDPQV